jgi:putative transposase
MRLLDETYLEYPYYGSRKMTAVLRRYGYEINRKRVQRLMKLINIEAIYPKKRTTIGNKAHKKYPYLLRNLEISKVNQVWCTDITYTPVFEGFFYLSAVMDIFSRFVFGWQISNTMDTSFCIESLEDSFSSGKPEIFNTDQGSQYTSLAFTSVLKSNEIQRDFTR